MSTYNTLHVQRRTLLAVLVVFVLLGFSGNAFAETSQKVLDKKDTTAVLGIVKSVSIGSAVLKLDNGDEITIKTSGAAIRKTDTVKPSKVESSVHKDKKSENRSAKDKALKNTIKERVKQQKADKQAVLKSGDRVSIIGTRQGDTVSADRIRIIGNFPKAFTR